MANQYIKNADALFGEVKDAFIDANSLFQRGDSQDDKKIKEKVLKEFIKSRDYKRTIKDKALVDFKELSGSEKRNAKKSILDSIYEHFTKTKPVSTTATSSLEDDAKIIKSLVGGTMKLALGRGGKQSVKLTNGESIDVGSFERMRFEVDEDSITPHTSNNKRPLKVLDSVNMKVSFDQLSSPKAKLYKQNIRKLNTAIRKKYSENQDTTIEYTRLDLTNILDKTSMDNLNKRGPIYDYWEEIYDKFTDTGKDGFLTAVENLVKGLKEIRKAPDDDFKSDLENFISVTENLKNLNYVTEVKEKTIQVGDVEGRAQKAINKFFTQLEMTATKTDDSGIDLITSTNVNEDGERSKTSSIGENLATKDERRKIKDLGNKITLDPLSVLYLKRDLEGIAEVFNDEDFKDTLREMFEDLKDKKKVKLLQEETGEELLEKLLDTHEAIKSHDKKTMHLPIFMFKADELKEEYRALYSRAATVREAINDFFRAFADLLEETRTTFTLFFDQSMFGKEPSGVDKKTAEMGFETTKEGLPLRRYIYGQTGEAGKKRELTKVMKQVSKVGEMIGELFVAPMNLPSVNAGEQLPFKSNGHLRIISSIIDYKGGQGKIEGGGFLPFKVMSKKIRQSQTEFITRQNLEELIPFLESINTGKIFAKEKKVISKVKKQALAFKEALVEIFQEEKGMEQIIDRDIASIFGSINKITNKVILETFEGQNVTEAYDQTSIENATEITPIMVLVDALEENRDKIADREKNKPAEQKVSTAIDAFLAQAKKLSPMKKSLLYYRILEAHDSLRILKGKEVHYATRDENNFDHVEDMLIKIQQEHNLDMSAGELITIVNEIDSFDNISKAHGINSEHVYLIKANFR